MGGVNKLLLEVDGRPMARRIAETLIASKLGEIVVVLGHEREAVGAALGGLPLRTVVNHRYRDGQMTSVRAGVAALAAPALGIMVCLSDQPLLTPGDIDFLIEAFLARDNGSIVVPVVGGQRGNPIVVSAEHRQEFLDGGIDFGCRHLIDRNPDNVLVVEAPNDHFLRDVDTAEAYAALSGERQPLR